MRPIFTILFLLSALSASAETLAQGERDRAMSHMHATRKAFLDSIEGVSDAQWSFKPDANTWSIAECAEHIAVSEDFIFDLIAKRIMQSPAAPEKKAETLGKDEQVLKVIPDRSSKFQAPEVVKPTNRWATKAALIADFKKSRDRNIAYVQTTSDDLRSRFMAHPVMKTLDAYQWVLLLSAHTERHTSQIAEVKQHSDYPKK